FFRTRLNPVKAKKVVITETIKNETAGGKLRRNRMCSSQVLAKISINCREKRVNFAHAFSGALRRLGDPPLLERARQMRERLSAAQYRICCQAARRPRSAFRR